MRRQKLEDIDLIEEVSEQIKENKYLNELVNSEEEE